MSHPGAPVLGSLRVLQERDTTTEAGRLETRSPQSVDPPQTPANIRPLPPPSLFLAPMSLLHLVPFPSPWPESSGDHKGVTPGSTPRRDKIPWKCLLCVLRSRNRGVGSSGERITSRRGSSAFQRWGWHHCSSHDLHESSVLFSS